MAPAGPETAASAAPSAPPRKRRLPRLGVGARLALGLAAVAAVLVAGEMLATRTAGEALQAVRDMQDQHEPLESRASAVLERLVDYDRAVGAFVQARNVTGFATISAAATDLEEALGGYFDSNPPPPVTPAARALREELRQHIDSARSFATRAAQRAQWVEERRADLEDVYQRIV